MGLADQGIVLKMKSLLHPEGNMRAFSDGLFCPKLIHQLYGTSYPFSKFRTERPTVGSLSSMGRNSGYEPLGLIEVHVKFPGDPNHFSRIGLATHYREETPRKPLQRHPFPYLSTER